MGSLSFEGHSHPFENLPPEKKEKIIECIEKMFVATERRIRDQEHALADAKDVPEGDINRRLDSYVLAVESLQQLDKKEAAFYNTEMKRMFEGLSGKTWSELEACMDGEGGFFKAVGLGDLYDAAGEAREEIIHEGEEMASGRPDIPGIDLSRVAEYDEQQPHPSGLDAGDLVRYKGGTQGRTGMLISSPKDGKVQVRWFGDDAPSEPQEEKITDLEIAEEDCSDD